MTDVFYTIQVKANPESLDGTETPSEVLSIALLDTAWKLLSEGVVRVTLEGMREDARASGVTAFPADEVLFANTGESYETLAPFTMEARASLAAAFASLVLKAAEDSEAGRQMAEADLNGGIAREKLEELAKKLVASDDEFNAFLKSIIEEN